MTSLLGFPARRLHDSTGLRIDSYTVRFAAQDLRSAVQYIRDSGARRAEKAAVEGARTPDDWVAVSSDFFGVGPVQIRAEILALLELLEAKEVRVVCEIGAYDAGSSILFGRAVSTVQTMVVMDLYVKNRWRLKRAALDGQRFCPIDGDSTHPRTADRLRRKLQGRQLDFILIDGDHRYAGVREDFLIYRHFVRPGGLIAFHDIVPVRDPDSGRWAGDVPTFWKEVSALYEHREFVASRQQDGLGIGVLTYDPQVSVDALV